MNENLLLPFLSLFIVLGFLAWAITATHSDLTTPSLGLSCSTGQCAVNRINGLKTCPENNSDTIIFDPFLEVCSDSTVCSNSVVPFAVQTDLSTLSISDPNLQICPDNSQCRCVNTLQCADFVTSYFIIENQDPSRALDNSRTVFVQSALYQPPFSGASQTDAKPFMLTDPKSMVCSVNQQVIDDDRLFPRQCLTGTLAYIVDSSIELTQDDLGEFPLSCVVGDDCPVEQSAVFDRQIGEVVCIS
uniref:Uncharacterized protein n=1 Tax=Pithovirus LCPAC404 TaxID=2506597 RepID=A0A481ZEJ9_9VIRU|nr:MAG: hypothetical protein LCPAC404_01230 [Pithovirus LCPAC404]